MSPALSENKKAFVRDLTTGPVGGHLLRQATPFALSLIAIFSFEAIDLFFLSGSPTEDSLYLKFTENGYRKSAPLNLHKLISLSNNS